MANTHPRTVLLSFRIKTKGRSDEEYDKRYDAVETIVKKVKTGKDWKSTTSVVVFKTRLSLRVLASMIATVLTPTKDEFVICYHETGEGFYWGKVSDPEVLESLTGLRSLDPLSLEELKARFRRAKKKAK